MSRTTSRPPSCPPQLQEPGRKLGGGCSPLHTNMVSAALLLANHGSLPFSLWPGQYRDRFWEASWDGVAIPGSCRPLTLPASAGPAAGQVQCMLVAPFTAASPLSYLPPHLPACPSSLCCRCLTADRRQLSAMAHSPTQNRCPLFRIECVPAGAAPSVRFFWRQCRYSGRVQ